MHEIYMKEALIEAKFAYDAGDFPVGCVIVDGNGVVCRGRRRNSTSGNEIDHAEIMALRELYAIHGDRISDELAIYSTMEPCLMCYTTLTLNNIHTVVYGFEDVMGGGTDLRIQDLRPLYSSKEIKIIPHIMRNECLQLFKMFFKEDREGYWQDSLLAQYTLDQD